jgi:hypothetical protein
LRIIWLESEVCSLRCIQTVEALGVIMADDWAAGFRPRDFPDSPPINLEQSEDTGEHARTDYPQEPVVDTTKILLGFEAVVKRLDAMDARLALFESLNENPGWLEAHLENLRALHHMNAEALMRANQQFSNLVIRKLDEMEERIKSDEPSYTNVLYSNPELFNEISSREEEQLIEKALDAAEALIDEELVEERAPDMTEEEIVVEGAAFRKDQLEQHLDIPPGHDVPLEILESYNLWKNPNADGSWPLFVKACGGPVKAKHYKDLIADSFSGQYP